MICSCGHSEDSTIVNKKKSAAESMDKWLSFVDSGNYSQSWVEAGNIFKKQISDSQWTDALKKVREPLRKSISRFQIKSDYKTSLPGVPNGEYVVFVYKTQFEKKKAKEIVTAVFEDNQWKAVGYFIK